eukprot:CAMPEP_0184020478 /NCGR_PEP_ID=MMETSP0954-20121128/9371_1 /TAXON_ID=627963 /ORGANISM="Aplanochytrium sp, Strain PBS07" /LENGTH=47 /DNA_ID= /DNA_START= /DNA_END= /DNA_ORIENTATION=
MALEGKWKKTPDVVVFDLDGCVWYPEMYHLWVRVLLKVEYYLISFAL